MITLSLHASQRSHQRAVGRLAIEACVSWGHPIRQPQGRTAFHLGRRDHTDQLASMALIDLTLELVAPA